MNKNPAQELAAGLKQAREALTEMHKAGADVGTLEYLEALLIDASDEASVMHQRIKEDERAHCPECRYAYRDANPEAIHGGTGLWRYECQQDNPYKCPVVRACGFRDPSDPLDGVPEFLKRQAT